LEVDLDLHRSLDESQAHAKELKVIPFGNLYLGLELYSEVKITKGNDFKFLGMSLRFI
jgi:hypothetical protein